MIGSIVSQEVLVQKSSWRIGFYLVAIGAVLMFLWEAIVLELARQMALQSNQQYLSIHIMNSYVPMNFGTILIGVWTALLVVFACTHPKSSNKNIEKIVFSMFGIYMMLSLMWFNRTILFAYWDYSTSPPMFPIYEALINLPVNIVGSVVMLGLIVVISAFTWYRYLKYVS
ncbi:MAG: hypothetical protein ACFFBR_06590 [Promethearchaeota archaeon]